MQFLAERVLPSHAVPTSTCSGRQLGACWQGHAVRSVILPAGMSAFHASTSLRPAGAGARFPGVGQQASRGLSLRAAEAEAGRPACSGGGLESELLGKGPVTGLGAAGQLRWQAGRGRRQGAHPLIVVQASSDSATAPPLPPPRRNPVAALLAAVRSMWRQVTQPLGNFGFGKRSIWEGGVGLFLLTGAFMLALLVSWVRGVQVRGQTSRYQAVFEFSQACGIAVGTPVRIRGVDVGSVVSVRPSLERIDVVAEIMDAGVVIPRNSLVEVNQSGLISETLIDITPRRPIPRPSVDPLSARCEEEGLIVCDRQRIAGQQGVSLDELVGICTKLAKQMDEEGVRTIFQSVDKVAATVEGARPLLEQVTQITSDLQPLLRELSEGDLLKNLEGLTKVATEAATDLRELNSSVLTTENTQLLRDSVSTLTKTLKHIESISEDVSVLTGDPGTRYNLKQLIESLSRLVND